MADLEGGLLHPLWSPHGEAYAERRDIKFGERIEAATIEGLAVETVAIG